MSVCTLATEYPVFKLAGPHFVRGCVSGKGGTLNCIAKVIMHNMQRVGLFDELLYTTA